MKSGTNEESRRKKDRISPRCCVHNGTHHLKRRCFFSCSLPFHLSFCVRPVRAWYFEACVCAILSFSVLCVRRARFSFFIFLHGVVAHVPWEARFPVTHTLRHILLGTYSWAHTPYPKARQGFRQDAHQVEVPLGHQPLSGFVRLHLLKVGH